MRRSERMAIAVSIVCLGLLYLTRFELPSWSVPLSIIGQSRTLALSGNAILGALLVGIACLGVHTTVPADPHNAQHPFFYQISFWPLPAMLTLASLDLIPGLDGWVYQIAAIGLTGASLTMVAYLQVNSRQDGAPSQHLARLVLAILAYGATWAGMASIMQARWGAIVSAVAVAALCGALALSLTRDTRSRLRRIWLYAVIVAMAMGEVALCLAILRTDALISSLVMLVVFYCLIGTSRQHLQGQLDRRTVSEYILVALAGLVLPWLIAR